MDRWIEHLVEPRRLILAWQPPPGISDRARWAVGELMREEGGASFRYLRGGELAAMNQSRSEDSLRAAGFAGYPAFNWTRSDATHVFRDRVLEAFLRRVSSPRREDFGRYLERFRLRPVESLSPFALLAVTGAALPSDGFSLVDPLDERAPIRDVVLEIMGYHYYAAAGQRLELGVPVRLIPEPTSQHDPNAVRVEQHGSLLGYINRLQAAAVSAWVADRAVSGWGLRENGSPDRPRAFIFAQVRHQALAPAA